MIRRMKKFVAMVTALTMLAPTCAIRVKAEDTTLKGSWVSVFDTSEAATNPWELGKDKNTGNGDDDGTYRVSSIQAPWTATLTIPDEIIEEPCMGMQVDVSGLKGGTNYKITYEVSGSVVTSSTSKPRGTYFNYEMLTSTLSRTSYKNDLNQIYSLTKEDDPVEQSYEVTMDPDAEVLRLKFLLRRVDAASTVTISNVKVYEWVYEKASISTVNNGVMDDTTITLDEAVTVAELKEAITTNPADAVIEVYSDTSKESLLSDTDTITGGNIITVSASEYVSQDYSIKIKESVIYGEASVVSVQNGSLLDDGIFLYETMTAADVKAAVVTNPTDATIEVYSDKTMTSMLADTDTIVDGNYVNVYGSGYTDKGYMMFASAGTTTKGKWKQVFDMNHSTYNPWALGSDSNTGNGKDDGTCRVTSTAAPWTATISIPDTISEDPCLGMQVDVSDLTPGGNYKIVYELQGNFTANGSSTPRGTYLNVSSWDTKVSSRKQNITNLNEVYTMTGEDGNLVKTYNIAIAGDASVIRLTYQLRRVFASSTVTISNVKVYEWIYEEATLDSITTATIVDDKLVVDDFMTVGELKAGITTSPADATVEVYSDSAKSTLLTDTDTIAEGVCVYVSADRYVANEYTIKVSGLAVLSMITDEFTDALTEWLQTNQAQYDQLTGNVALPTIQMLDNEILTKAFNTYPLILQWRSGNRDVVFDNGVLNGKVAETTTVTMSAYLKYETDRKGPVSFDITILAGAGTLENKDHLVIEEAITELDEVMAKSRSTANNLSLLSKTNNGTAIVWSSSDTSIITDSGVITRAATNKTAVLTATLTYGTAVQEKEYMVTVLYSNNVIDSDNSATNQVGSSYPVVVAPAGELVTPEKTEQSMTVKRCNRVRLYAAEHYTICYILNGGKTKSYTKRIILPVGNNTIETVLVDSNGKEYTGETYQIQVKKPKAKKSISLNKGNKKIMWVRSKEAASKITYSTKNKKVASITKKGVITAKRFGQTVVTAKLTIKGKTYTVKTKVNVE
ncbi:MAG: immunoglobulin-like domain-containing protein [Lachnospiraceae bacterium]